MGIDPDRGNVRGGCRAADWISDISAAGTLLRAGDARLPAGHSLRVRMARLPGSHPADQTRNSEGLSQVCGSTSLHAAGAGDDARDDPAHKGDSRLAVGWQATAEEAD